MSKEDTKVEYKQIYLRGYFPIRHRYRKLYNTEITPNEYYKYYVTKLDDDTLDTYQREEMSRGLTYLYRILDGYKYLIAVMPPKK